MQSSTTSREWVPIREPPSSKFNSKLQATFAKKDSTTASIILEPLRTVNQWIAISQESDGMHPMAEIPLLSCLSTFIFSSTGKTHRLAPKVMQFQIEYAEWIALIFSHRFCSKRNQTLIIVRADKQSRPTLQTDANVPADYNLGFYWTVGRAQASSIAEWLGSHSIEWNFI